MVSVGGGKSGATPVRALLPNPDVISARLGDAEGLRSPGSTRTMHHYLNLVANVPIFDVCFQTGLARVPAILDALEHALGGNALPKGTPADPCMVRN